MPPKTLTLIAAGLIALLTAYTPARAGWTNDPWNGMVSVCDAPGEQQRQRSCQLAGGRSLVAWRWDFPGDTSMIYFQVLDGQGRDLLQHNGITLVNMQAYWSYSIDGNGVTSDGQGGSVLIFRGGSYPSSIEIFGQRIDSVGRKLWGEMGTEIAIWSGPDIPYVQDVIKDTLGNFFLGWYVGWPTTQVYVQKFDVNGQRLWGDYGRPVCVVSTAYRVRLVPDYHGGVMVVWRDERYGLNNPYLFFQHLNASGEPLVALNGTPVLNESGNHIRNYHHDGVPDGQGGSIWVNSLVPAPSWVNFFRLNGQGQTVWCSTTWTPYVRASGSPLRHADGTYWVSISEFRPSDPGLFLYHFDVNGNQLLGSMGRRLGGILTNCSDGIISGNNVAIGQVGGKGSVRVDSSGCPSSFTYYALSHSGNYFLEESSTLDGADGVVYAFEDQRNTLDWQNISAQRVNADGTLGTPRKTQPLPDKNIDSPPETGPPLFIIDKSGPVKIEIFDLLGRKVLEREEGFHPPGPFQVRMDKMDLPSGLYIVTLISAGKEQRQKIVITH